MVARAINISRTAYIKYTIFDTVIHNWWIMGRIQNISPEVQSGDISHPASMIAGDTSIVRISRIILSPATILFSIFLVSSSWVFAPLDLFQSPWFFSPLLAMGQVQLSAAWTSFHVIAYLITQAVLSILPFSIFPKNPTIPTSARRKDVTIFLNIVYVHKEVFLPLHHKFHFFANNRTISGGIIDFLPCFRLRFRWDSVFSWGRFQNQEWQQLLFL